jgi:hypothetical protein
MYGRDTHVQAIMACKLCCTEDQHQLVQVAVLTQELMSSMRGSSASGTRSGAPSRWSAFRDHEQETVRSTFAH